MVNIFILSLLSGVILTLLSGDRKLLIGGVTAVGVLCLLSIKKYLETRPSKNDSERRM